MLTPPTHLRPASAETQLQTTVAAQNVSIAAGVRREFRLYQLHQDVEAPKATIVAVSNQREVWEKKFQSLAAAKKASIAVGRQLQKQAEEQAASIAAAAEREEALRAEVAARDASIVAVHQRESRLRQEAKVQAASVAAAAEREKKLITKVQAFMAAIRYRAPIAASGEGGGPAGCGRGGQTAGQPAKGTGGRWATANRTSLIVAFAHSAKSSANANADGAQVGLRRFLCIAINDSFCVTQGLLPCPEHRRQLPCRSWRAVPATPRRRRQPSVPPAIRPVPADATQHSSPAMRRLASVTRLQPPAARIVERRLLGRLRPLRGVADLGRQQPLQHGRRAHAARPVGGGATQSQSRGTAAGRHAVQ